MALFREQARDVDIIITTALIPGKRAPVLITKVGAGGLRAAGCSTGPAGGAGRVESCDRPAAGEPRVGRTALLAALPLACLAAPSGAGLLREQRQSASARPPAPTEPCARPPALAPLFQPPAGHD